MEKLIKKFNNYLINIGIQGSNLNSKLVYAKRFILWVELRGLILHNINYQDAHDYIESIKIEYSISTQKKIVNSISNLYMFLVDTRKTKSNPFGNINIKKVHKRLPSNLLSKDQIEKIYTSNSIGNLYTEVRNKCILSLICYQGLLVGDIEKLNQANIDLNKGVISITPSPHQNGRVLKLEAFQILLFDRYIKEYRNIFLRNRKGKITDRLFMSTMKSPYLANTFTQILKKLKELNPELISFIQIKQSLISHWSLKENIKDVQYKSGHKYISSTQRFNLQYLQEMRTKLIQFHPLST